MKERILELVDKICDMESTNCRSLNKASLAREIMNLCEIDQKANIQEIPLDWDRQVVICFTLPESEKDYELFCGIGNDGKYHCELRNDGEFVNGWLELYPEEKLIWDKSDK